MRRTPDVSKRALLPSLHLLTLAWGVQAVAVPIPWLVKAVPNHWFWHPDAPMAAIIALHLAGALCPMISAACFLARREVDATVALLVVACAGLFIPLFLWTHVFPWLARDFAHLLLCLLTLVLVGAHAVLRASSAPSDETGLAAREL